MFDFHECEENKAGVEIFDYGNRLEIVLPWDCGYEQDSCTQEYEIICCPFCGYRAGRSQSKKDLKKGIVYAKRSPTFSDNIYDIGETWYEYPQDDFYVLINIKKDKAYWKKIEREQE